MNYTKLNTTRTWTLLFVYHLAKLNLADSITAAAMPHENGEFLRPPFSFMNFEKCLYTNLTYL
jgi:hypothetical protein